MRGNRFAGAETFSRDEPVPPRPRRLRFISGLSHGSTVPVFPLDSHSEEGDHVDEVRSTMSVPQTQSHTDTVPSVDDQMMMVVVRSGIWNILFRETSQPFEEVLPTVVTQAAFASFDAVDLSDVFTKRARVLKSLPAVLKGAFRSSLRLSLQEAERGRAKVDNNRSVPAWKLFLLLLRLLLFRSCRGGHNTEEEIAGSIFSVCARAVVAVVAVEPGCNGVSTV